MIGGGYRDCDGKELKQEEITNGRVAEPMTAREIQEKSEPTMVGKLEVSQRQKKSTSRNLEQGTSSDMVGIC
jgi:hypothetical protein